MRPPEDQLAGTPNSPKTRVYIDRYRSPLGIVFSWRWLLAGVTIAFAVCPGLIWWLAESDIDGPETGWQWLGIIAPITLVRIAAVVCLSTALEPAPKASDATKQAWAAGGDVWDYDFAWDSRGAEAILPEFPFGGLLGIGQCAFILLLNFSSAVKGPNGWSLVRTRVLAGLLALCALAFVGVIAAALVRRRRARGFRLSFERFPFFCGDRVGVRLQGRRPIAQLEQARVTLRAVQEVYEAKGPWYERRHAVRGLTLHEETFDVDGITGLDADDELRAALPVPHNVPGTQLSERPPRYWMLVVRLVARGKAVELSFFLPVYARPAKTELPSPTLLTW